MYKSSQKEERNVMKMKALKTIFTFTANASLVFLMGYMLVINATAEPLTIAINRAILDAIMF